MGRQSSLLLCMNDPFSARRQAAGSPGAKACTGSPIQNLSTTLLVHWELVLVLKGHVTYMETQPNGSTNVYTRS